jgi:hypothetical protein
MALFLNPRTVTGLQDLGLYAIVVKMGVVGVLNLYRADGRTPFRRRKDADVQPIVVGRDIPHSDLDRPAVSRQEVTSRRTTAFGMIGPAFLHRPVAET